jgi:hypothetical protein
MLSHHPQSQQYSPYYQQYYDQAHHQGGSGSSGQWQQHQYSNPSSFAQQGVTARQASSGSMSAPGTTDQGRTGSFDYAQQQYSNWDSSRSAANHQWQPTSQQSQQQQQSSQQSQQRGSSTSSSSQAPQVMSPWQGYNNHHFPPQQVAQVGGQVQSGQYGSWNQWNNSNQPYYQQQGQSQQPQQQQSQQQQQQQQQPQQSQQQQPVQQQTSQQQQQQQPAAQSTPTPAPAATPTPAPAPPTTVAPTATKKKSKKETAAAAAPPPAPAPEPAPAPAPAKEPKSKKRPAEKEPKAEKDEEKKPKKAKKEEEKKPRNLKSQLKMPRQAPSAWQLFFTDELNKAKVTAAADAGSSPGGTPIHPKLNVAQIAKDAGVSYAKLSPERKAYYARKVEEGKIQYEKDRRAWEATLTPEDIKNENAFRALQRKEGKSRKGNLKDPNAPKKPLSAYFLFLKGIRENDDLRNEVWADESETTRQSVLAAEKWRGLSDDEKRPYLQQAEKDKQDYEALRKIYEDDAAARARGEATSERPTFPAIQSASIVPPKSLLEKKHVSHKSKDGKDFTSPTSGQFDSGLEMDSFHAFEDMDLTGLEGMTGHGSN